MSTGPAWNGHRAEPEQGMMVHLEKVLEFDETHPVRARLVGDRP